MKIVIDIPDEMYDWYDNGFPDEDDAEKLWQIVKSGTPLPKGHGRIIDESQVTGTFTWDNGFIECFAPTIVEADKAESEE